MDVTEVHRRLQEWAPIADIRTMLDAYLEDRPESHVRASRIKAGDQKKFTDEVFPAVRFACAVGLVGQMRFPLDDQTPDCWYRSTLESTLQGIEITVSGSREQVYIGRELNEGRIASGYLGLRDNAPSALFEQRVQRRGMYTSEQRLAETRSQIEDSLAKKNEAKYQEKRFDLLISADLKGLPDERWIHIQPALRDAAREMPFRHIHVVSDRSSQPFGFQIK
jgi:hypothetical protein